MNIFRRNLTLSVNKYDAIALVASGLDASISDAEITLSGYKTYRVDRDLKRTTKERGGGVIVYIRERIWCQSIVSSSSGLEFVVLQLKYAHVSIILICTYLPPFTGVTSFSALEQMQNFADVSNQIYVDFPQSKFVIVGDFNIPGIYWYNTDFGVSQNGKSTCRIVNDVAELL